MKKYYVLLTICLFTVVSGCKKGLEPTLFGTLSTTNFPITEADFQNYVLEVYKPFQSKWGYYDAGLGAYENDFFSPEYGDIMLYDYGTDEMNIFTGYGSFFTQFSSAQFSFLLNQGKGNNHFEKIRFITRITQILNDVNKSSISAPSKALYNAEARMARGWIMYYLLQMYGPVPVITDPALIGSQDAYNSMARPSRADFVKYIVDDLTFAAANLPKTPAVYGRFNQALALTVLMRTYMNEKDFTNAEKIGKQILTLGYSLVNNYASLFTEATEQNTETMWAVVCTPNQDGAENHGSFNPLDFYAYPADYPGNKITASFAANDAPFSATWSFYNSFDSNDKRRIPLIASYTNKKGVVKTQATGLAGPVIAKYPDLGGNAGAYQGNDMPKARLGDVMLMLAEAINQNSGPTAEAVGLVNQVRAAHGGASIGNVPANAIVDKATFDLWILKEEGWDMYFEGDRKMELLRHGQYNVALQSVGKIPSTPQFPIATYNISASGGKLTQTTGY